MSEIDDNPEGEEAKKYYKSLKEVESSKPRRKPAKIIIKTIKRGRTISQQEIDPVQHNSDGSVVPEEELEFQRKYVDFNKIKWPEVNEIEMVRPDYKSKGKVKL